MSKQYEVDPQTHDMLLIFAADGMLARLVKTIESKEKKWKFCLFPTKDLDTMWDLESKKLNDPRYNIKENWYELEVDKTWVIPLNSHPYFMRWLVMSDWNCKEFIDPFVTQLGYLTKLNKQLQMERDGHLAGINSLVRKQARLEAHMATLVSAQTDQMMKIVDKFKPVVRQDGDRQ